MRRPAFDVIPTEEESGMKVRVWPDVSFLGMTPKAAVSKDGVAYLLALTSRSLRDDGRVALAC
jgi:hypothetical protein